MPLQPIPCVRCGGGGTPDAHYRSKTGYYERQCKVCRVEAAVSRQATKRAARPPKPPKQPRVLTEDQKARKAARRHERRRERRRNDPEFRAKWKAEKSIYRRGVRKAKPSWVPSRDLAPFYHEAERLSRETGVAHEVDHIVPLRHPLVCGLHVPWNLQVLSAAANNAKSNTLPA